MVKCANCQGHALYTYQVSNDYHIHYCQYHLPRFLFGKRSNGQLDLVVPEPEVVKVAKKKVEEPVVEEPVVEEPTVEETPAEE